MIELYGQQNAHWDKEAVEAEVKAALKSSLGKKVSSLDDDKWMFEGDGDVLRKYGYGQGGRFDGVLDVL